LGALQQAINGDPANCERSATLDRAERLLRAAADTATLVGWNDRQPSKKPILAAFDKAIELAESGK
jgi:hypothetical protein